MLYTGEGDWGFDVVFKLAKCQLLSNFHGRGEGGGMGIWHQVRVSQGSTLLVNDKVVFVTSVVLSLE